MRSAFEPGIIRDLVDGNMITCVYDYSASRVQKQMAVLTPEKSLRCSLTFKPGNPWSKRASYEFLDEATSSAAWTSELSVVGLIGSKRRADFVSVSFDSQSSSLGVKLLKYATLADEFFQGLGPVHALNSITWRSIHA